MFLFIWNLALGREPATLLGLEQGRKGIMSITCVKKNQMSHNLKRMEYEKTSCFFYLIAYYSKYFCLTIPLTQVFSSLFSIALLNKRWYNTLSSYFLSLLCKQNVELEFYELADMSLFEGV